MKSQTYQTSLHWVRKAPLRELIHLSWEQLSTLRKQADEEFVAAGMTKDWIDAAMRLKLKEERCHES